jgi:hypothetical protein
MSNPLKKLVNLLTPPQPLSWQTLISLSLFSWAFALFASTVSDSDRMIAPRLINNFAFVFFIVGFFWFQQEKRWHILGIKLQPILVGLLISIWLFKDYSNSFELIIRHWPIIAGLVVIIPALFKQFKFSIPSPEQRPQLIMVLCLYLLIACWVNFYFLLQQWLFRDAQDNKYLTANLSSSLFVVRLLPPTLENLNEKIILNALENFIQNRIKNESWETVEFLIKNIENIELQFRQSPVYKFLQNEIEESSWTVEIEIVKLTEVTGYEMILSLIWKGAEEYRVEKRCQVKPSNDISDRSAKLSAEFTCANIQMIKGKRRNR